MLRNDPGPAIGPTGDGRPMAYVLRMASRGEEREVSLAAATVWLGEDEASLSSGQVSSRPAAQP